MNFSFIDSLLNRNPVSPYISDTPQRRTQAAEVESDSSIQFATILHAKLQGYQQELGSLQTSPLFADSNDSLGIIQKLAQNRAEQTTQTEFGYRIDSEGFFTKDFNKAAGIPEDFKIHVDSAKELVATLTSPSPLALPEPYNGMSLYHSVDVAKTFGNAYQLLSVISGNLFDSHEQYFNNEQLESLPKGFATRDGRMDSAITGIYQTQEELDLAWQASSHSLLSLIGLREGIIETFIDPQRNMIEWDNENYQDAEGNLSKAGVLMKFLNSHAWDDSLLVADKTELGELQEQSRNQSHQNISDYYDIVEGKMSLSDYLADKTDEKSYFLYFLLQQGIMNLDNISDSTLLELRKRSDDSYNNIALVPAQKQAIPSLGALDDFDRFVGNLKRFNAQTLENSQNQLDSLVVKEANKTLQAFSYQPTSLDKLIEAYSGMPSMAL